MPSKAPAVLPAAAAQLAELGAALARERKRLKLSATVTAESAGISRLTLHRIERGEPSVAAAAWVAVADALRLKIGVLPDPARGDQEGAAPLPQTIRLADYPQLRQLAWHLHASDAQLTPAEALQLYERNWRHLDRGALQPHEVALIRELSRQLGAGDLRV